MSKNLTLTLNATDIKTAVKADSYITGVADKSIEMEKNAGLAFNEQAGDENYHDVKLYRTMKGSLAKFEAAIAEFIETSDKNAVVRDTLTSASVVTFDIIITVNDRMSGAFANTLANLAQEYIINSMLYYWWQPIKRELAKDYLAYSIDNLRDVRRCLAKCAPEAGESSYTDVSGKVTPNEDLMPEFDGTQHWLYIKGNVSGGGATVNNPVIEFTVGMNIASLVTGEDDLEGLIFSYDDNAEEVVAVTELNETLITNVRHQAELAFANGGFNVTVSSIAESYGSTAGIEIQAYLKK